MSETEWFKRLAEVPGVGYEPPQPLPRPALRNARPKVVTYDDVGGRKLRSLMWPSSAGGETSASPVQSHSPSDPRNASTQEILANLGEALELPGLPSDYHFAIQSAAGALWSRRKEDPSLIETSMELYLLDLRLVEAQPQAIRDEYSQQPSYYAVEGLSCLVDIYTREGSIREALAVSKRGERFGQAVHVDTLEAQVAALNAEPLP